MRKAIGAAALKISHGKHLTGQHNSQLDAKILVVAEEAFWSGDKAAAGVLKDLVTSDDILVDPKHLNPVVRRNLMRFVFISNEKWVIPTGDNGDARRFLVLRANETHKQDRAYFSKIIGQMASGGLAGMVAELMAWRPEDHGLTWGDLRFAPRTAARDSQAGYSLSGPAARLRAAIDAGEIVGRDAAGVPYCYGLNDESPTVVLRSHLLATLAGRVDHGGDTMRVGEAVKLLLGADADADRKGVVSYERPDRDHDDSERIVTMPGRQRIVTVPPAVALRRALAARYGGMPADAAVPGEG